MPILSQTSDGLPIEKTESAPTLSGLSLQLLSSTHKRTTSIFTLLLSGPLTSSRVLPLITGTYSSTDILAHHKRISHDQVELRESHIFLLRLFAPIMQDWFRVPIWLLSAVKNQIVGSLKGKGVFIIVANALVIRIVFILFIHDFCHFL